MGLHDLRFLPLYWTLLDSTAKAGKPGVNGGTSATAVPFSKVPEADLSATSQGALVVWVCQRADLLERHAAVLQANTPRQRPTAVGRDSGAWTRGAGRLFPGGPCTFGGKYGP